MSTTHRRIGAPARSVPIARPSFDESEEQLVREVLRSRWVTQGPRVAEFEAKFAAKTGAREAVAVSSGTTALFLALHALGIGPGDEVIVPSLSFIATANVITHCQATPVFVEVDPRTYNIDPEAIEPAISPRTRAIMTVHQLGMPADLDRIDEIARGHDLPVVEDAACAIGSIYKGRPVGDGANLGCFSFHARKVVAIGEGGMITTRDPAIAARLRRLRHQGMSVSDLDRHEADCMIIEEYPEVGYNFRLSDIHAAVGLAQLAKLDHFVERRRAIAARYNAEFERLDAIIPPFVPAYAEPNYQSYIVRVRGADTATRNRILNELHRNGVGARRGLMAAHLETCYRGASLGGSLRHTEEAAAQTIVLPIHPELTEEDQGYVVDQLRKVLVA